MSDGTTIAERPALTLERRLGAPPHLVFNAWTKPGEITRWFGRKGATELSAEAEAKVGGRYRICFRSEDGERHEIGGSYLEIVPDRKLVFTWAWHTTPERQSLVTVSLAEDGDGTRLTLTHEKFFDEAARDRHLSGWAAALGKLEALFA